ncbi:mitochondrial carrier, ATP:ADP antiporter [Schizosaccharomyces osmophilus]|uniref:Mitochondrial carrier, ATP:ADP antiporter n=1 Tax=Schizosaccharomyces osmophilus TaxID=2545709 RepID=A0AAE9W7Z2_9SCHI|nr:mitochondrial carrier, ATP:ADP antiporter [Schizosaccharomyces osmophilus]WBW71512.1 mitochondrial carrier, ATP:ADP antiporter [Schizosaccharomyces osmophilus]
MRIETIENPLQSPLPCGLNTLKDNVYPGKLHDPNFINVLLKCRDLYCQSFLDETELKRAIHGVKLVQKQQQNHFPKHGYWKIHASHHDNHKNLIIPQSWMHDTPHMKLLFHRLQNLPDGDFLLSHDVMNGMGYFFSGGIAGIVSRTCTAPLDRLKVMLISDTCSKPSSKYPFSTLLHTSKSLYSRSGIRGFFVGNGINVLKVMPESSIKFGSYEAMKTLFGISSTQQHNPLYSYLAGGFAGTVAQFFIYPVDTLKFRIQCSDYSIQKAGQSVVFENMKQLYKSHGVRGYYRGILIGVLGMFPYSATDLGTFEGLKKTWIGILSSKDNMDPQDVKLPNGLVMVFGALSGSIGATLVFPLNVLRTRLQTQGTPGHRASYNGFVDCFFKTTKKEGFGALYKGLAPNLLKVAPSVAISYLVYENSKSLLRLQ